LEKIKSILDQYQLILMNKSSSLADIARARKQLLIAVHSAIVQVAAVILESPMHETMNKQIKKADKDLLGKM